MSAWKSLSSGLLWCAVVCACVSSAPVLAQPARSAAPLSPGPLRLESTPSGETSDLLVRVLNQIVLLFGQNPISPRREIDRVVGLPWTLNPDTQERLVTLSSRLRYELLRQRAEMFAGTNSPDHQLLLDFPNGMFAVTGTLGSGFAHVDRLVGIITSHLSIDQVFDGTFYAVASQFPGDFERYDNWHRWRRRIANNAGLLGILALTTQALLNTGVFRISGTIVANDTGRQRLSWSAVTRNLGIQGNPSFGAGLQYNAPSLEAFLTAIGRVNAPQGYEEFGIEGGVQHVHRWATERAPWEATVRADARLPIVDTVVEREGRFQFVASGSLRRERLGSPGHSGVTLTLSERVGIDVTSRLAATTAIAIDLPGFDGTITLQHQLGVYVDGRQLQMDQRLGLAGGGTLESNERDAFFRLNFQCSLLRRALDRNRRSDATTAWDRYRHSLNRVRLALGRRDALKEYCVDCEQQQNLMLPHVECAEES